eukprot:TRINITY_DN937_c0_g1_i1.p1 TRINITY_DN937_c0_g1~~TRINITY_DN937_c0_g1_i1.p1  ORF type:complete len:255 (-),score=46.18 TRINITY_DN937_c0_g1_i1:532-1296(-)
MNIHLLLNPEHQAPIQPPQPLPSSAPDLLLLLSQRQEVTRPKTHIPTEYNSKPIPVIELRAPYTATPSTGRSGALSPPSSPQAAAPSHRALGSGSNAGSGSGSGSRSWRWVQQMTKKSAKKKTPNSYILFCLVERDAVRALHPRMTHRQVTARLGELWRDKTPQQKEAFCAAIRTDPKYAHLVHYTQAANPCAPARDDGAVEFHNELDDMHALARKAMPHTPDSHSDADTQTESIERMHPTSASFSSDSALSFA